MILGRPTNLILGAFTALFNVVILALGQSGVVVDPGLVNAINVAFGSVIVLVAFTPPVLNPGDSYTVNTPDGETNFERVVTRASDSRSTDDLSPGDGRHVHADTGVEHAHEPIDA